MRNFLALLLSVMTATAAMAQPQIDGLSASQAYAYPPLKGPNMGVAFVTLRNDGDTPWQLSEASSPAFGKVEIHETLKTDGVMRMREIDVLPLPPGGQVTMQPGGIHLMLMQPSAALEAGQTLELSLRFTDAKGEEVSLTLPVPIKPRGAAGGHEHH
jgi:Uncharacterized protein conserved in bacteria